MTLLGRRHARDVRAASNITSKNASVSVTLGSHFRFFDFSPRRVNSVTGFHGEEPLRCYMQWALQQRFEQLSSIV